MRYLIESVTLDKHHPLWPNLKGYKVFDTGKREWWQWTLYTTLEAAEKMIERKISREQTHG